MFQISSITTEKGTNYGNLDAHNTAKYIDIYMYIYELI